jgi:transcriptional regulator GlxA family with amidase domain
MNSRTLTLINFIEAHSQEDLPLSKLAMISGLSRGHVCFLFKTDIGLSPARYVAAVKMREAAELLGTSPMSVKQVMIEMGYTDKSLFVRHFRRVYGVCPSEYRYQRLDGVVREPTKII